MKAFRKKVRGKGRILLVVFLIQIMLLMLVVASAESGTYASEEGDNIESYSFAGEEGDNIESDSCAGEEGDNIESDSYASEEGDNIESYSYAEEDRFYSMENKIEADKDGYIKLTLDKSKKEMTVDTYFDNCIQIWVDCSKDGQWPYIGLATEYNLYPGYSFTVSLENLTDGHYLIEISPYLKEGSKIRNKEYFHIVIEDGQPFFIKDFAYDLAKKTIRCFGKIAC